jgi:hypothetical protein
VWIVKNKISRNLIQLSSGETFFFLDHRKHN